MEKYDPQVEPEPEEWLGMDEQERILLVADHHKRTKEPLPDVRIHSTIHVVVENQVALGDEVPVRRTLERLQSEGLDRHEAIHAVGSTFAEQIFDVMNAPKSGKNRDKIYSKSLELLTAKKWSKAR